MLRELLPDFVLRRNLRVANRRDDKSSFVASTHGSHHIGLTNNIAAIHNRLKKLEPTSKVDTLPELPNIDSGEVFGLTKSDYSTTFNGLLAAKEELSNIEDEAAQSLNFDTNDDGTDLALRASRVVFEEWRIDTALLNQPQSRIADKSCKCCRPSPSFS
jgi:hypothetical protein